MDISISNYWLCLITNKKIVGLLPSNWVFMTPAWHLKAKLGPSLLFKGQLPMYDVVYHPVFAACFSGRSEKRSSSILFMTYWLKLSIKSVLKYLHYSSLSKYDFICISQLKKVHEEKTLYDYFSLYIFSTSHNRCIFLLSNNLSLIQSYI